MILRNWLLAGLLAVPAMLWAADAPPTGDTRELKPPKGATVAIIAFEDLQCPDCAAVEGLLLEASEKYHVPVVRKDFPLPFHLWSYQAHVLARYFDTQNAKVKGAVPLGEQFRRWVFATQGSINKQNLRGMAERFADQHGLELPETIDPKGELAKLVQADFALGQQVGVIHTPTVFVVSVSQRGAPMIENLDRDKLFAMIEKLQSAVQQTGETKK